MSRRKGRSVFRALLFTACFLFVLLGASRIFMRDSTEKLPQGVQEVADISAALLNKLGEAVQPVQEPREPQELPWNLTLVNWEHPISADWKSEFTELRYGEKVDTRMYPYLQEMFDDCRAAGLKPLVYSGYRSRETQTALFAQKVEEYQAAGSAREEAELLASQWVARPGTSEHELGLAVDVNSEDSDECPDQAVYDWLAAHCQEYGFILRYPADKVEITGVQFEPWHFRYVGQEAAREIVTRGITLEEYLEGNELN